MKYTIEIDDKPAVKAIKRIQKAIQELNKETIILKVKSDV